MTRHNFIADISKDRILQLSNDLSEGMATGTVAEWRAVAKHFRDALDAKNTAVSKARSELGLQILDVVNTLRKI